MDVGISAHAGQSDVDEENWQFYSLSLRERYKNFRYQASSGYLQREEGQEGASDLWLAVTWLRPKAVAAGWLDVRARLKVPTANENESLGTGSWDQDARLQLLSPLGTVTLWNYVSFRRRGTSERFELQNSAGWGSGIQYRGYSLTYDGSQPSQPGRSQRHSLSLIKQFKIDQLRLSPYIRWNNNASLGAGISVLLKEAF